MTHPITRLADIAGQYDVIVFDQWGVLHNGTAPYPGAIRAVNDLTGTAAVLSNSGKRSGPNAWRIEAMGFPAQAFATVMTSGEALWRDIAEGRIAQRRFFAIERASGDALAWAEELGIELTTRAETAEAILLMGLPDGADLDDWRPALAKWQAAGLPIYCSNPDRQSPRAGGLVTSPGAIAFAYTGIGGASVFYGKPHGPVFAAVENLLGPGRYLMVGDSMEHDIAGANAAGWDSLLIEGGLYKERFATGEAAQVVADIAGESATAPPTYRMKELC